MNKEDIKKGLKTCAEISCDGCPYDEYSTIFCYSCSDKLKLDACALITEQEQEIEELEENIDMLIKEQKGDYDFEIKQAKIDVLNKLKSLSIYDDNYLDGCVFIDDIDKLLEEYENDATRND